MDSIRGDIRIYFDIDRTEEPVLQLRPEGDEISLPAEDPPELLRSVNELLSMLFVVGNDEMLQLLNDLDFLFAISSNLAPRELGPIGQGKLVRRSRRFSKGLIGLVLEATFVVLLFEVSAKSGKGDFIVCCCS